MRRKKIIEASVVCILLLLLGAYMEFSDRSMDDKNRIIRGSPGSGRQEVELTLNAGEQLKDYDYQISVPAQCIDEKTAQSYFSRAEKEIDETFFPEGEEAATLVAGRTETLWRDCIFKCRPCGRANRLPQYYRERN